MVVERWVSSLSATMEAGTLSASRPAETSFATRSRALIGRSASRTNAKFTIAPMAKAARTTQTSVKRAVWRRAVPNSTSTARPRMIRLAPSSLISSGIPSRERTQGGTCGLPVSRLGVRWTPVMWTSFHNQCGNHTEHPMIRLGVRKDMAVECPRPWIVAVDDDVIPLAGRDVHLVHGIGDGGWCEWRGVRRHCVTAVIRIIYLHSLRARAIDRAGGQRAFSQGGNGGIPQEIPTGTLLTEQNGGHL